MYVDIYVCMFIPMCLCGQTHATACTGDNLQCLSSPSTLSEIGPQVGYSGIIRLADPQVSHHAMGEQVFCGFRGSELRSWGLSEKCFLDFWLEWNRSTGMNTSHALCSPASTAWTHSFQPISKARKQRGLLSQAPPGHFLAADCQHCRLFCRIFDMDFFFKSTLLKCDWLINNCRHRSLETYKEEMNYVVYSFVLKST